MTVIWPDGSAEEVPEPVAKEFRDLIHYAQWFSSLSKEMQAEIRNSLEEQIALTK